MDKITGESLYEKTCPPGEMNVTTGGINPKWEKIREKERSIWDSIASDMETIANEERSPRP